MSGAEVRNQNGTSNERIHPELGEVQELMDGRLRSTCLVLAAQTIANIVKSSLGPVGLDKMMVDNIGVSLRFGQGR